LSEFFDELTRECCVPIALSVLRDAKWVDTLRDPFEATLRQALDGGDRHMQVNIDNIVNRLIEAVCWALADDDTQSEPPPLPPPPATPTSVGAVATALLSPASSLQGSPASKRTPRAKNDAARKRGGAAGNAIAAAEKSTAVQQQQEGTGNKKRKKPSASRELRDLQRIERERELLEANTPSKRTTRTSMDAAAK
jgi:hypothetical protein